MKYEINQPYAFEVKNVVRNENSDMYFEVDIEGNTFPVKAYEPQLGNGNLPNKIVCRIKLDKEKNAFLCQYNRFLYPYIYRPKHRYLFEVTGIDANHIKLTDKYGIRHEMPRDSSNYCIGEILVRLTDFKEDGNGDLSLIISDAERDSAHPIIANANNNGSGKQSLPDAFESFLNNEHWSQMDEG